MIKMIVLPLFSHSSTGALQLKLHSNCYECAAESLTLSTSAVKRRHMNLYAL